MFNASEVHEQNIFTADYKTLTPLSFQNLTIDEEADEKQATLKWQATQPAEEHKLIRRQTSHTKEKREARSACGKISSLLRDKQSGARGSYMFRKRRKRSERFAIVGYGTQPTAEENEIEDYSEDSVIITSSDDEIAVYDHPGPNNLLELDKSLTSSSKIIQHQLKNLATDAKQMKGKGARMFAKRQERMDKFIVDGNSEQESNDNVAGTAASKQHYDMEENEQVFCNEEVFSNDPPHVASFGEASFSNALQSDYASAHEQIELVQESHSPQRQLENQQQSTPNERSQLSSVSTTEPTASNEIQISLEPSDSSSYHSDDQYTQRMVFRSVKPPKPTNFRIMPPVDSNIQNLEHERKAQHNKSSQFSLSLQKPVKIWSSVTFDPSSKPKTKPLGTPEEMEKIAYPCSVSLNEPQARQKTLFTSKTTPMHQPFKSVCTVPSVSKSKSKKTAAQPIIIQDPTSVQLLQKPLSTKAHAPLDNKVNKIEFKMKSVHGDRTPPSASPTFMQEKDENSAFTPLEKPQQTYAFPQHFNKPTKAQITPKVESSETEEDLQKPKVAACMKLLDPSKGRYEPKMSIVYKSTPTANTKSNQKETTQNSNNKPLHFYNPAYNDQTLPQGVSSSPSARSLPDNQQKKPQALGSLAGDLKGRGAKMFEKQQMRMDNFTKESNGAVLHGSVPSAHEPISRGPEKKAKEKMSRVVGEFKKVSADNESPNRPSVTRTTKSKDPYHYHNYYVSGRAPSADDFVNSDDFYEVASDSNLSSTSFDRYSRTSSNVVSLNENEDCEVGNFESKKNAPGIAPKPKISFSEKLSSPSCQSQSSEGAFAPLPSPPTYQATASTSSRQFFKAQSMREGNGSFTSETSSQLQLKTNLNEKSKTAKPKFTAKATVTKWQPNSNK